MPRSGPHALALFSLLPLNERARSALARNDRFASWVVDKGHVLDIGHTRSISGDNATLATLGRNGDIELEGSSISRIQCSFEINWSTKVVMFLDRSHNLTSQVFGQNATPFIPGRPRQVVVQKNVNTMVGMGGEHRDIFQFELIWHHEPPQAMEMIKNRETITFGYEENPRFVQTIDWMDTILPSQPEARSLRYQQRIPRYATIVELGSGQFGTVWKAVDVDTGELLAVKRLRRSFEISGPFSEPRPYDTLKREVEILSRLEHPHIVDYIGSQGWDEGRAEIIMGLKEGTLKSLVRNGCSTPITNLSNTVSHHMLQAIDFLATKGIVHRDIKPENILYVSEQGQYKFQLGDFGLSNRQNIATTFAGSLLFMAPEIFQHEGQTHKADVWSLYVTMLWTLDVEGFRHVSRTFPTDGSARARILSIASSTNSVFSMRAMARLNPDERASAAQMLVKCFDGKGLVTARNKIPPLIEPVDADSTAPDRPVAEEQQNLGRREGSSHSRTGTLQLSYSLRKGSNPGRKGC